MDITRIGPDDWQTFREVRLASLAGSPGAFGSRHADWVEAPEPQWRSRLTTVPLTLLAQDGTNVVGVVSGQRVGEHEVELISMWVAPAVRGAGVARALIDAVVEWATARTGRRSSWSAATTRGHAPRTSGRASSTWGCHRTGRPTNPRRTGWSCAAEHVAGCANRQLDGRATEQPLTGVSAGQGLFCAGGRYWV